MLLCDAAQSVGGKLNILGGGWTQVAPPPGAPVTMALAIRIRIPWDRANDAFPIEAVLRTDQGEPVLIEDEAVMAGGNVEVGRPPGLEKGTPLDAMLAFNFPAVPLGPGSYVWHLEVEGTPKARANFRVLQR